MKALKKFNQKYLFNNLIFISVLLMLPLFMYKLGQTSLISWDEAWYAEVARNIIKTDNPINLTWNGKPYFDHPPTGYLLMALTYKIFGVNEFWTRFPSSLSGIFSIILLYLLGRKLFNPLVGLSSAIALSSATWFIFRSRSGNLDVILTMFFLLTLLLAIIASGNKKYLLPLTISLSLLFLTKTMVPLAIIPPLVVIFYKNKLYKWKDLIAPTLIFSIIVVGWFTTQITQYSQFIGNYLGVGLRGVSLQSFDLSNLSLTKEYLYNGIGRWFWPSILSLMLSVILTQKRFLILIVFFFSFMLPLVFSPKIQIWHLIPLFPILILSYFGFTFVFFEKYFKRFKYRLYAVVLLFSTLIYFNQIKMIWYQFIDIPAFITDEAILSKEAAKFPQEFIIDGEYIPAALFYSEKSSVRKAPRGNLTTFFQSEDNILMITNQWRLDESNISPNEYKIFKADRDKILILYKKH